MKFLSMQSSVQIVVRLFYHLDSNPKKETYMSQTGNTKKIAEAIYDAIPQPKEIKRVEEVTSLEGYDLSFLGFPTLRFGPD